MTEQKLPFQSFRFSLIEGQQPRSLINLVAPEDGAYYQLSVTKGSAANPLTSFKREIPFTTVLALRDALQTIGVFGWEEEYGDTSAPGARRWSLTIVFQKDVFSFASKGGSDVPAGFDEFLEELYRLDFPRPAAKRVEAGEGTGNAIGNVMGTMGVNSIGSMSSGDLGAYAATKGAGGDYSFLKGMFGAAGMPDELKDLDLGNIDVSEMQKLLADAQQNPEAMQARMKDEFKHMTPDEKNKLLDMLAKTSGQTREWWRRFLEG